MNQLLRMLLLTFGALFLYKNRYRVLNILFGVKTIRAFLVKNTFRIPGLREKVMTQIF